MLTFYHSGALSCSVATHIALEEAGADYHDVKVDLAAGEQRKPEYLKINPKGRVPVLVTDKGPLTETVALLLYVAQTHPAAKLAPTDPFDLAKLQAFNAYLASTVHVAHAHKLRGARWTDDAGSHRIHEGQGRRKHDRLRHHHRERLSRRALGDGRSIHVADPYLHIITIWMAGDGVDLSRFPKLSAHKAAMEQRPAVKKVLAKMS